MGISFFLLELRLSGGELLPPLLQRGFAVRDLPAAVVNLLFGIRQLLFRLLFALFIGGFGIVQLVGRLTHHLVGALLGADIRDRLQSVGHRLHHRVVLVGERHRLRRAAHLYVGIGIRCKRKAGSGNISEHRHRAVADRGAFAVDGKVAGTAHHPHHLIGGFSKAVRRVGTLHR